MKKEIYLDYNNLNKIDKHLMIIMEHKEIIIE